jgi:hypothetical protein
MDPAIQRALNDKLYDKRKVGALEWVNLFLLAPLLRVAYPDRRSPVDTLTFGTLQTG